METDLLPPQLRADQLGREDVEAHLRASMSDGVLSHGWIISAPKSAGKAAGFPHRPWAARPEGADE
ncbi:MAG: hypothetical protein GXP04_11880 [Alphaproteobacteria bacterium]|nr:hypothetical protein [Alphaproteobacteria bacterium]